MNNILRNVLMRRSTYQFDPRPISEDDLMDILEEGKVLSNAAHNQEWHFTVLQNRALIKKISDINERYLSKDHADFLKNSKLGDNLLLDAPVLLIISGKKDAKYVKDAANMVFGSMMLVADKYGIASCWLTSTADIFAEPEGQDVLRMLSIPAEFTPLCVGAFGYKKTRVNPNVTACDDNIVNIIK